MKLIKVEVKGFKSFAERTVLNFDGGIVGIIGPNGSGKSNINDAIKWVLGESSAKSLRGDNMYDVIFAGSKDAPALSRAEVSLTFDNYQGVVSLPHKKITITRVINRGEGKNEYYINGEIARKSDITEIAMESGIGKSSLAIISQGTISDIAQATPEQRRGIFEEAAGTSKYKQKKKQALSKLGKVTENLEKISAIVNELARQLIPLRKQKDKALIYKEKRSTLEKVEIALIVEDVSFYENVLSNLKEKLEDYYSSKDSIDNRIKLLENDLDLKNERQSSFDREINDLQNKLDDITERIISAGSQNAIAEEKRKMILSGEIAADHSLKMSTLKDELSSIQQKIANLTQVENEYRENVSKSREKISNYKTNLSIIENETRDINNKLSKVKIKKNLLEEQRDKKTNLFSGPKAIFDNKHLFPGYQGIVSDLLKVDSKYALAIETILGNSLQNVVVNSSIDAVKAINFLKENRAGRATFMPLDKIKPKFVQEHHESALERQVGFLGVASKIVKTENKFSILNNHLLGNILISDSIESATKLNELIQSRYTIVTLEGDLIRPSSLITGGGKGKTKDFLGLEENIERLKNAIPKLEEIAMNNERKIINIKDNINSESVHIGQLNFELAKVTEKLISLKGDFNEHKSSYEAYSNKKLELDNVQIEEESIEKLNSEKSSIRALLNSKREIITQTHQDIVSISNEKIKLERLVREMIEESQESIQQKNQAEYIIEKHKERLSGEYGLTIETALDHPKLDIDIDDAKEIVANLRREIKELGNINLDAIDQFNEVDQRHSKLKESQDELTSAQNTIMSAISQMDQIIINKFSSTFDSVNEEIGNIFRIMFGGGDAKLKYTDPTNLLETGIEVIAQPPGKTIKNLKLFSGGEKALVAISLLFAILKTKPLPLCLLDEVEAALDDANVVRYAEYLRELKNNTQFLVVTHRVGTMSRVDHLFGATMQNKGITSFFTVNLSEAKKLIDNN